MRSIRWKLVFMYLTLVFIVMLISGTFIIISLDALETNKAQEELKQCAVYIKEQIVDQYQDPQDFQEGFVNLLIMSSSMRNVRGHILDDQGNTIASSAAGSSTSEYPHFRSSALISALNGNESFSKGQKDISDNSRVEQWLSYAYPVKDNSGKVKYVIYVQIDAETINSTLRQTTGTILISVLLALVLTGILGFIFANTITEPIAVLTKKANLLAKGRLEQHVTVQSNDEIGQLTRSFNTMAREMRKTVTQMENENNKLEIVLHNMTDGVLAFDDRGVLLHANRICYDMLDIDDFKISFKWILDKLKISRDEIKPDNVIETVFKESDKYISATLFPYSINKRTISGVVVVLHDITKHRQLDNMRKEFVANVSHEIGTPLTTIMGYTELLLDGAIDDKNVAYDFLKEIAEAANRMKLLRDDLLDLSRFDTKVNKFNKSKVDLARLVEGCLRQHVVLANNKNQTLEFKEPKKEMFIYADAGRISQVITNVLSNATKYSPEGASISLKLEERTRFYYLSITDTGMGIPKEDLDRIFERFYRVDKARSRAMGGNGLGLAIAKEIMEAHGGRIDVYSQVGKGTTMVLVLPKYKPLTKKELEVH